MSELRVDKSKRDDWLKKNGPPDVLEKLGLAVTNLAEKAEKNKMQYKENSEVEEETMQMDVFDSMPTGNDEITSGDSQTDANEKPNMLSDILKDHVTEPVVETVKEPVKVEEPKVEAVTLTPEQLAEKASNDELIDVLMTNLINPVLDILKSVQDEQKQLKEQNSTAITELTTRIGSLEKSFKDKGIQEDLEEITPPASLAAQVKERLLKHLNVDSQFGKPVNEPVSGPKQTKSLNSASAPFAEGL